MKIKKKKNQPLQKTQLCLGEIWWGRCIRKSTRGPNSKGLVWFIQPYTMIQVPAKRFSSEAPAHKFSSGILTPTVLLLFHHWSRGSVVRHDAAIGRVSRNEPMLVWSYWNPYTPHLFLAVLQATTEVLTASRQFDKRANRITTNSESRVPQPGKMLF